MPHVQESSPVITSCSFQVHAQFRCVSLSCGSFSLVGFGARWSMPASSFLKWVAKKCQWNLYSVMESIVKTSLLSFALLCKASIILYFLCHGFLPLLKLNNIPAFCQVLLESTNLILWRWFPASRPKQTIHDDSSMLDMLSEPDLLKEFLLFPKTASAWETYVSTRPKKIHWVTFS